jgi:hypothetical protein
MGQVSSSERHWVPWDPRIIILGAKYCAQPWPQVLLSIPQDEGHSVEESWGEKGLFDRGAICAQYMRSWQQVAPKMTQDVAMMSSFEIKFGRLFGGPRF